MAVWAIIYLINSRAYCKIAMVKKYTLFYMYVLIFYAFLHEPNIIFLVDFLSVKYIGILICLKKIN